VPEIKGFVRLAQCLLSFGQARRPATAPGKRFEEGHMAISFDKALGIHEKALNFRAQRAEVLANNIANADTPHYKARDLEFSSVLASQTNKNGTFNLNRTSARHIEGEGVSFSAESLQYRTPHHPSIDGNTVDAQVEQAAYTKNAVDFQASFTFLNSKFKGLMSAIKGE